MIQISLTPLNVILSGLGICSLLGAIGAYAYSHELQSRVDRLEKNVQRRTSAIFDAQRLYKEVAEGRFFVDEFEDEDKFVDEFEDEDKDAE